MGKIIIIYANLTVPPNWNAKNISNDDVNNAKYTQNSSKDNIVITPQTYLTFIVYMPIHVNSDSQKLSLYTRSI